MTGGCPCRPSPFGLRVGRHVALVVALVSPQATAGHHLEDDASVLRAAKELHVGAEELAVGLRVSTDGGDLPEDRREVLPSKLDLFTRPR